MIHFADQVTRGVTTMREPDLAAMAKYFSDEQIVELICLVGVANFTNRVNEVTKAIPDLG